MKKLKLLLFILLSMALTACDSSEETLKKFDVDKISFEITDQFESSSSISYTIKVTNNTEVLISHLDLYLSFPIILANGIKENSYMTIGIPLDNIVNLEKGESIEFVLKAPLDTEFMNLEAIDSEHPSIELKGYVNKDIPFGISGSINALVKGMQ